MNDTTTQVKVTKEIINEVEKIRDHMIEWMKDYPYNLYSICCDAPGSRWKYSTIKSLRDFGYLHIKGFSHKSPLSLFSYSAPKPQQNAAKLDHLNKFIEHYKDKV